ncbi:MAG: hypothetical protein PVH11_12600 [Anaerolineae bacterium]|jgi:hypothetical protein
MTQEQTQILPSDHHTGWLAMLDTYQVEFLLVDSERDRDLFRAAQSHPYWTVDCRDDQSVLLLRVGPPGA